MESRKNENPLGLRTFSIVQVVFTQAYNCKRE